MNLVSIVADDGDDDGWENINIFEEKKTLRP